MEPITTSDFLIGLAINFASEIIVSGFKSLQDTSVDHDLNLAYKNALYKWRLISKSNHQLKHLSKQKLCELQKYLNGKETNFDDNTFQFIKIFEKEICDKKYLSLYNYLILQSQKEQFEILNELNEKKQISSKGPIPELKIFSEPSFYIKRSISGYTNPSNLVEIIKKEHAVALLGEGGLGKSTELNYVASILSKDGWYCGLVRLINYADSLEKLIESQFENWQHIPDSYNILILLDGLDEVSSSNISKAENEIIGLTRIYKNVHFLISYRNSYSLFLSLNDEKSESIDITRVTLDPISEEFVKKYINDNATKPAIVIEQFQKQNLLDLCKNPFYLIHYIEIINKTGRVPDNKSDFFEQILSIRFQSEKQKGSGVTHEVRRREGNLRKKLEVLALTMQLAGKYQIANNDIQEIINDPDLLDATRRIVLYECGITDSDNWRFEHNNFQEYLTAKKLAQCNWVQMHQILFLPNKKLKPKWYNAISFLINQLDPIGDQYKQLIGWLNENDRVAFIKLEVIHLDQPIRDKVFYSIYNYYKEKEIVFYAEFSAQEFAKFCDLENNQELIDFLLSELKPEMKIQNLYNIVELFSTIKLKTQEKIDRIAIALSVYLKKEEYNEYNINATLLEIYIKWDWKNVDVFYDIINDDILIIDGSTRSVLLDYLKIYQPSLITASLVLRCLNFRQRDTVLTSDMYYTKEAISVISESEIVKLIDELTLRVENDLTRKQMDDFIKVVKAVEERASILHSSNDKILSAINQFVLATLNHVYPFSPALEIRPFYEKNNLIFQLFEESFMLERQKEDCNSHYKFKFSGYLADEECVRWILKKYEQDNGLRDDIIFLRFSMGYYGNRNAYHLLTEQMNSITNGTFFPDVPDRYTETHKKVEDLYAYAILDKDMYIGYIEKAFALFSKDEIKWEDYWNRQDRDEHIYDVDFQICHRCLREFMEEKKITAKHKVLTYINTDQDWNWLQLNVHYELSESGKLQKENIEWIINWCKQNELEIDFKNALTDSENGGITYTYRAVYYLQFCLDTGYYSHSKKVLLDLVACLSNFVVSTKKDDDTKQGLTLYDYLKLHLTSEEINEQIVQNLKDGISAEMVLNEYLKVAENENLTNAVDLLPKYIIDIKWKKWIRFKTLSTYFHLNGTIKHVKMLLDNLTFDDEYNTDWSIINEFINQDKILSAQKLLGFLESDQIDRYKLTISLIKCGRTEGLDLLYQILNGKNNNGKYDEFRNGDFEGCVKSGGFKGEDVIPRLADLVLIHLRPEFKDDKWSNAIGQLFNLLAYYYNYDNQSLVFDALTRIEKALSNSGNTPIYQIIYRNYQKLQLDLDIISDSECEIGKAIQRLKEIGVAV